MLNLFSEIHELNLFYQAKLKGKKIRIFYLDTVIIVFVLTILDYLCILIYMSLPYLTRYYPFSMFYQDQLFHYQHRHLKKIVDKIETEMDKIKKPVLFLGNEWDQCFLTIDTFFKDKISNERLKRIVKKSFNLTDLDVYVRDYMPGVKKILIDREVAAKI